MRSSFLEVGLIKCAVCHRGLPLGGITGVNLQTWGRKEALPFCTMIQQRAHTAPAHQRGSWEPPAARSFLQHKELKDKKGYQWGQGWGKGQMGQGIKRERRLWRK